MSTVEQPMVTAGAQSEPDPLDPLERSPAEGDGIKVTLSPGGAVATISDTVNKREISNMVPPEVAKKGMDSVALFMRDLLAETLNQEARQAGGNSNGKLNGSGTMP